MNHSKMKHLDKKEVTDRDINKYYETLKMMNDSIDKVDNKQKSTIISIVDDKPIGIAFTGDWHLGARGVNYSQFDKDMELIKNTEGLYAIGMGDYKDNQSPYVHSSGTFDQLAPPRLQDELVKSKVKFIADKWLALIRGCHDDWDSKLANKDFIQELSELANTVNLWHGGKVTVMLGDQTYEIIARHKYKYESNLNTTNPHRNLVNNFGHYDIVALAHRHYPDLQLTTRMGKKLVYLRSGTYKLYDDFGQKIGGYEGIYGVPVVILYPDKHEFQVIDNLETAVGILKSLRGSSDENQEA